jgi:acetylornithine/succinyldiaminopimelate/putrescine aminotransferase
MIAVEFCPDFSSGLRAFAQELATRMPGNWQTTYDFLPLSVRQALQHATDAVEHSLSDLFVQKLVSKMANEHRILTFVTANNNRVMRIQPPLVLQESEAQQFVKAFEESCFDLSTVMN